MKDLDLRANSQPCAGTLRCLLIITAMLNFVTVVEDDEDERTALRRVLRAGGFYVQDFASAEAYLAAANREPLCLILDMQLVGMSASSSSAGCAPAGPSFRSS